MEPALAQFEQQYKDKMTIVKVNVSDKQQAAQYSQYKGSRYIPETVVIRDGKVLVQKTGALSVQALEDLVRQAN